MNIHFASLYFLLAGSLFASIGTDIITTLDVDADKGICTLTIKNTSEKPYFILDAFNQLSGMSSDFPMGTSIQFEGDSSWKPCYMASSNLFDHGPLYTSTKDGWIIKGPIQNELLFLPGKKLVTTFRLQIIVSWMVSDIEHLPNGMIRLNRPFKIKSGVFIRTPSENRFSTYISSETFFIRYSSPIKWKMKAEQDA